MAYSGATTPEKAIKKLFLTGGLIWGKETYKEVQVEMLVHTEGAITKLRKAFNKLLMTGKPMPSYLVGEDLGKLVAN